MRRNIVHVGAGSLTYEIREIVAAAHEIRDLGQSITWENIGDPVLKGERPPDWIRGIIHELVDEPETWGYCATEGVLGTREFLAERVNARGGVQVAPRDILFFNGLGDAVAHVYGFLRREARILGPSPAYSTHSSAEAAHSGYNHLTYELDPGNGWLPNLDDIRNKVKYNDSIAGILLLTPDNPTGAVYPREVLEEIAEIARQNRIMVIADEIYANIVYNGKPRLAMSQWIGDDVPAIAMRGISKDYPWPGGRCGWLEVLNRKCDQNFSEYVNSLLAAKRLEVSSTTLPQRSIPRVMGDPRFDPHCRRREAIFEARAQEAYDIFRECEHVLAIKPGGAFYFTIMFRPGALNDEQTLPIENPKVRERVEELVKGVSPDKRFVYYLMGHAGIVIVPLTGFYSSREGFRMTLLESDDRKRRWTYETIRSAINMYVESTAAAKV
jgi:aspartate/methionine/tyrosine aminotransferase